MHEFVEIQACLTGDEVESVHSASLGSAPASPVKWVFLWIR